MDPYYTDELSTLWLGDVLDCLNQISDESVQTVITSPPYYGLRDYDTAVWVGGDEDCPHKKERNGRSTRPLGKLHGGTDTIDAAEPTYGLVCGICGATRADSQIGLEETPASYVDRMVAVFREVRRVLRPDGTVWLNIGDSYSSGGRQTTTVQTIRRHGDPKKETAQRPPPIDGIKPKDLIGIPWMLAFALRADGWYLRQDIIWAKQNPMPESVTDRCTKAHEYVFLLSKSERYFYDHNAILDPHTTSGPTERVHAGEAKRDALGSMARTTPVGRMAGYGDGGRNKRSVWSLASDPFPGAHFAAFPPALVRPMILAGTSAHGACTACGAPFARSIQVISKTLSQHPMYKGNKDRNDSETGRTTKVTEHRGWDPTCKCFDPGGELFGCVEDPTCVRPCVVLDIFVGSGTTAIEAKRLGRVGVGIDLSTKYLNMAIRGLQLERRPSAPEAKLNLSPEWIAAFGDAPADATHLNPRPKLVD